MTSALFSVDCTCGRKVVIDSDTMRRVEAPRPEDCRSTYIVPTRRVSLVDEYTLDKWDIDGSTVEPMSIEYKPPIECASDCGCGDIA